jgi:hypothetical protein
MKHGSGLLNAVFTMGVVATLMVWGVTSLTNGDPFWFLPSFNARAETLTVYWDGTTHTLQSGDPGYEDIMTAFAEAVTKPAGYEGKVAFSEENINQYKERNKLLAVQFAAPVQVHTRYPYNEAKTYLIPLDRSHAEYRRIFSFPGYLPYTSGPINAKPAVFDQLYAAVEKAVTMP